MVRWATVVLLPLLACSDLREFRGSWHGKRVGDAPQLFRNVPDAVATLEVDAVAAHRLDARISIAGFVPETAITSLEGAEADVLSGITFGGAPLRVFLAFMPVPDGGGEALVVVALYDDRRIEVRLLRGGMTPLYGIFALSESSP
ncbi:MAG TPA: hypothetical protein VFK02_33855 [Kofleriaceae bacterium]|nr:hypothetical protein [Kofleriaceae bacterium]